ncbi:ATP-binding protein [Mycolicibacterium sp. CH28]|uniref:ATP-binding protein n=1 Tax=Mycolicibacterium sp. CH28 TaxID=2512237 RepID=UPI001082030A|nr:ATP-binding protein [Mycolicibacterium sp. CH28]TGD86542.1 ATP-binding protein [Mycolicibacterium sp. CH28]
MTTSSYPTPPADGDRFICNNVVVDAHNAARIRDDVAAWLRTNEDLNGIRFSDIVLAVNEALANAAEFAYLNNEGVGSVDVEAVRDGATLTITVSDQGCWRDPTPVTRSRVRGRGIPLMRALADELTIDTSQLGTTVCLRFDNVYAFQDADDSAKVG